MKTRILIIAFAALAGWAALQTFRASHFRKQKILFEMERDQAVDIATGQRDSTTHYIGLYKEEVAKVRTGSLTTDNLIRLLETERLRPYKNFSVKPKQIEALSEAHIKIDPLPAIQPDTIYIECTKAFRYRYQDEYNLIAATVLDTPVFRMNVPVYGILRWERRRVLGLRIGKKLYSVEVSSPNKLVKIDSLAYLDIIN